MITIYVYHMPVAGHDYQIVGDNVDLRVVPRYMTLDRRTADYHWFHMYAVKHRVKAPSGA